MTTYHQEHNEVSITFCCSTRSICHQWQYNKFILRIIYKGSTNATFFMKYRLEYQTENSNKWIKMNNYRNLSDAKSEFYLYLCRQSQNMVYNKTRIRRVQDD